jgi:outer membrane protein OmpA-like peptidoglycan-associated protein
MARFFAALYVMLALVGVASADTKRTVTRRGGRVIVTETSIEVFGPLKFDRAMATFAGGKSATKMLDAMAGSLVGNPSITLIEIRAFGVDARAGYQMQALGEARANAIVAQLVARGVARKRLVAHGEAKPRPGETSDPSCFILARDNAATSDIGSGLLLQKP